MVEIAFVEIGQRDKAVKIVNSHLAILKSDQTVFAQLAQHPVDVNRTQTHGIGQKVL